MNGQKCFLSGIAHELCTPIATTQFGLGNLERRVSEEERPAVADIQEEAQHMSALVNELLSFDAEYLFLALSNLVRNAIRYAGHAGPIRISARAADGMIHITVADSGPGVPEHTLEEIFAPFYRLDLSRSRETGGLGLGLAIVKNCVESCGGAVHCRNLQPSGLEVEIRLPEAKL